MRGKKKGGNMTGRNMTTGEGMGSGPTGDDGIAG
jgi:hypothetical protein